MNGVRFQRVDREVVKDFGTYLQETRRMRFESYCNLSFPRRMEAVQQYCFKRNIRVVDVYPHIAETHTRLLKKRTRVLISRVRDSRMGGVP
ncbi:hypothetical protein ACFLQN_04655 [Candidatus Aenigmatarchaeota archaeon]